MSDGEENQSEYVKLISSDGFEFIIHCEAAMNLVLLKICSVDQNCRNEIPFRDIKGIILEVVCRYLYYKWQYEGSVSEIPDFKIDPEIVLETLMTADFLEC
ncbi:unnamed protein product [Cunninghamella echinulata]